MISYCKQIYFVYPKKCKQTVDHGPCCTCSLMMSASYHKPKKSSSHKSYGGSSGYKGYKGKKSGKKGKNYKSKHFDKKGAQKKGHNDSKKYYGDMKKGNKGHKAAKYGKKGHHAKGHKTKGFKNTYHKNEYSKKTKFYDSYDNGGYHKKYGGYKGYFGGSKGSKFKGGKDKAGYYGDKYGKKGHDSKGGHHSSHKGEKGGYGHKGKYGSKAAKGKGHGGYGHHDHHHGYGRSLPSEPLETQATAYGPEVTAYGPEVRSEYRRPHPPKVRSSEYYGKGREVIPEYDDDHYVPSEDDDSLYIPAHPVIDEPDYGRIPPEVRSEYWRRRRPHPPPEVRITKPIVYDYNTNEDDVDISSASPKFPGSELSRSKFSYDLRKRPESSHFRTADALPVHYDHHYDDNIHDDYDDFDNYDGYDYALEKEQENLHKNYKRKPSLPPKVPEYNDDYEVALEPEVKSEYGRRPYPPLEARSEPSEFNHRLRDKEYYVPKSTEEEEKHVPLWRPRTRRPTYKKPETEIYESNSTISPEKRRPRRPKTLDRPKVKDVKFYQNLSDPSENRQGYSTGFYKSWDSSKPNSSNVRSKRNKKTNFKKSRKFRTNPQSAESPTPPPSYIGQAHGHQQPRIRISNLSSKIGHALGQYQKPMPNDNYHPFSGFHQTH